MEWRGLDETDVGRPWECETCAEICGADCCPRCGTYHARIRETEEGADGDKLIFAEIAVEPKSVYVTEKVRALLTIGIRIPDIDGVAVVEYTKLMEDVSKRSNLSVFDGEFESEHYVLRDRSGNLHGYTLFRTTEEVLAERVGQLKVGPVCLKAHYPTKLEKLERVPSKYVADIKRAMTVFGNVAPSDHDVSSRLQQMSSGGYIPIDSEQVTAYASPVIVEVVASPQGRKATTPP